MAGLNLSSALMEADGRQLAIDMLRELGERWNDQEDLYGMAEANITEALVNREPDIMRRYLASF